MHRQKGKTIFKLLAMPVDLMFLYLITARNGERTGVCPAGLGEAGVCANTVAPDNKNKSVMIKLCFINGYDY